MRLHGILIGLGLSVAFTAGASATPVTTIWVDNATGGSPIIQEYNISTGALLDQFNGDGSNGRGVVQVGDIVYYTTAGDNNVYAYNYVTNTDLGVQFSVAGASALSTMAYDGTDFWIGDYSGTNHAYLYSPTGTLLKTVSLANCSGFCDGLEYGTGVAGINGGNPFLISNRFDGGAGGVNQYDVYDTNGNLITADLITGVNTFGNTGIAFDGTTFYVDNVYGTTGSCGAPGGTIDTFNTSGAHTGTIILSGNTYFCGEDLSVNYTQVLPPPTVPEPASLALLATALTGFGLMRRRRKGM